MSETPEKKVVAVDGGGTAPKAGQGAWGAEHEAGHEPAPLKRSFASHMRGTLIAGFLTAIPLFVTVLVIAFVYGLVTKFTQLPADWIVKQLFGDPKGDAAQGFRNFILQPIIALGISFVVVYLLGVLGTFVIGRRLLAAGENFLSNLPMIKGIYGTTKQVISVFRRGGGGQSFQRVVLVEFPRIGTWTIGFVTKTITDTDRNQKFVCVFIPMTPNPTSGFFQMFEEAAVRETGWTVDQGIKIVLSGGLLAPDEMAFGKGTGM